MASITLTPPRDSALKMLIKGARAKPNPLPPTLSLSGQTALITGSNTGIGLTSAHALLKLGLSHLIMGVRSIEKGNTAAQPLRSAFPSAKISVYPLDMLSYPSIQSFVTKCASVPRLDIAILNAGMTKNDAIINPSTAHEEVFQVNYLSTALLSILLLPLLKSTTRPSPSRLTLVSSGLALTSAFPNRNATPLLPSFDDPKSPGWKGLNAAGERYMATKTLVLMLTLQLSSLVSADNVIVNTVDPGFTSGTSLNRATAAAQQVMVKIMHKVFARTPERAALTYVDAAVVRGRESHGCFLMDWEVSA
jgi:NAD(P)-dependent dehydrogenase (short-subunit alcohol dehydrogenase family)